MSLIKKTIYSASGMLLQQAISFASQFLITVVTIRNVPRGEYGEMALVLSYGVIFNTFNMAVSSIFLRDYPKLSHKQVEEFLSSFFTFNAYKSIVVMLVTFIIGIFFTIKYENALLIIMLAINTGMIICQYYYEPFQVLFSVTYKQHAITQIIFATTIINVLISFGVLIWPSVLFVVLKNLTITILTLILFCIIFFRDFDYKIEFFNNKYLELLIRNVKSFSLWSHLQSILSDVVYRADILILGWLNTPFQTLGNYNIALQIANLTKIVPQIVQYHTTLSVSNLSDEKKINEVVHIFTKIIFALSVCIMVGYVIWGKLLISIMADTGYEEIFNYGLYILGGLCLFNSFRSLIAYCIISHSIKQVVLTVNLPAAIFAVASYFIGGIYWGVQGVLIANILIAIMLSALTIIYVNKNTNYKWSFSILTDYEIRLIKKLWTQLFRKQPIS